MPRSVVNCQFVLRQFMLCCVKTKPEEFSSSNRNIFIETFIKIKIENFVPFSTRTS